MHAASFFRTVLALGTLQVAGAWAQLPPGDGPNTVSTVMLEPSPVKFDESLLSQLKLPPGFKIDVYAKDMQHVRWLQVAPNGDVYASRPRQADVLLLRDTDRDGRIDAQQILSLIHI